MARGRAPGERDRHRRHPLQRGCVAAGILPPVANPAARLAPSIDSAKTRAHQRKSSKWRRAKLDGRI